MAESLPAGTLAMPARREGIDDKIEEIRQDKWLLPGLNGQYLRRDSVAGRNLDTTKSRDEFVVRDGCARVPGAQASQSVLSVAGGNGSLNMSRRCCGRCCGIGRQ